MKTEIGLITVDRDSFLELIPSVDDELAKNNVKIHARSFHAFRIMAPNYSGPLLGVGINPAMFGKYEGPNLLEQINTWYKNVYASRVYKPTTLGKIPVIIRNEVYLIHIFLGYGSPVIDVLSSVDGLTAEMAKLLTDTELQLIHNSYVEGHSLVYEFEDLHSQLNVERGNGAGRMKNPFMDSAFRDRDTGADCLEHSLDTNGAVFHSQQLAEKMLKAVLYESAGLNEEEIRKKYHHRIKDVFKDVKKLAGDAFQLENEVRILAKYKMDIRYTSESISKSDAVEAYWSGLRIGGFCATVLSGHERR